MIIQLPGACIMKNIENMVQTKLHNSNADVQNAQSSKIRVINAMPEILDKGKSDDFVLSTL